MEITEERRQALLTVAAFLCLIIFFSSFILFAYAIHIKVTIDSRMALIETYNSNVLPAIFVAVGAVNLLHNITAIYTLLKLRDPAQREGTLWMLVVVLVAGVILVLFESISAIVSFVHIGILDDEFRTGISKAMKEYVLGEELKQEIDGVQMDYECCGDQTYTDWFQHPWLAADLVRVVPGSLKKFTQDGDNYYADDVPFSCCDVRSPRPCIHHHVHDDNLHFFYNHLRETTLYVTGCRHILMDIYGTILLTVGWVALVVAALKTCSVLLVRLIQTSLFQAGELMDWEATTVGYIYYEPRGGDQGEDKYERKKRDEEDAGPTTTDEETTSVASGEGATSEASEEGDTNANTTVEFESDFSTNASGVTVTTSSSSASSSSNSDDSSSESDSSSSSSWEDLTTTDSDAPTSDVSRSGTLQSRRYRRRNEGLSPAKSYQIDNLKSSTSVESRIGAGETRKPGSSYPNRLSDAGHGERSRRPDGVSRAPYASQGYSTPQLKQRRNRGKDPGFPNHVGNSARYPEEIHRRDQFMATGPLSKLRQRSKAYLDEDDPGQADRPDQGLLSRIKAHLTNRGSRAGSFGGLFSSGYQYTRVSAREPEWESGQNTNINAECGAKMKTKKRKMGKQVMEEVSALHQTADFIDESSVSDAGCFPGDVVQGLPMRDRDTSHSQSDAPTDRRCSSRSLVNRGLGSEDLTQNTWADLSTSNTSTNILVQRENDFYNTFNYKGKRQKDTRNFSSSLDDFSDACLSETAETASSTCTHSERCNPTGSSIAMTMLKEDTSSSSPSMDDNRTRSLAPRQLGVPVPLKRVSFSESVAARDTPVRKTPVRLRCSTPYHTFSVQVGNDLSEYDLVPTSIRPLHKNPSDQEMTTPSSSSCGVPARDLDAEVAEIICGSSTVTSSVSIAPPEAQASTSGVTSPASGSTTETELHVGPSPARETNSSSDRPVSSIGVFSSVVSYSSERSQLGKAPHGCQATPVVTDDMSVESSNVLAYDPRVGQSPCKKSDSPKDRGHRTHIRSCKKRSLSNAASPLTPTIEPQDTHQLPVVNNASSPGPLCVPASKRPSDLDVSPAVLKATQSKSEEKENGTPNMSTSSQGHCLTDQRSNLRQPEEMGTAPNSLTNGTNSAVLETMGAATVVARESQQTDSPQLQAKERFGDAEGELCDPGCTTHHRGLISPFY